MLSSDIKIGLRVNHLINDMTALVVGNPEAYRPNAQLVRIKYENSTRFEYTTNNHLKPLPIEQQYPAHGGTYSTASDSDA